MQRRGHARPFRASPFKRPRAGLSVRRETANEMSFARNTLARRTKKIQSFVGRVVKNEKTVRNDAVVSITVRYDSICIVQTCTRYSSTKRAIQTLFRRWYFFFYINYNMENKLRVRTISQTDERTSILRGLPYETIAERIIRDDPVVTACTDAVRRTTARARYPKKTERPKTPHALPYVFSRST